MDHSSIPTSFVIVACYVAGLKVLGGLAIRCTNDQK